MKVQYNFEYRKDFVEDEVYHYVYWPSSIVMWARAKRDPRNGRFYAWRQPTGRYPGENGCVPVYLDTVLTCPKSEIHETSD